MVILMTLAACSTRGSPSSSGPQPSDGASASASASPSNGARPSASARASGGAGSDVPAAADRAVEYLAKLYSPEFLFDDPYITECARPDSGCDVHYRELDHAVLVLFYLPESVLRNPRLAEVKSHSERVMATWLEKWKDEPLDMSAIDLYALFPYYYPGDRTKHMLAELTKHLSPQGDWEPYDTHGHPYRKVCDELWLVMALARNKVPWQTVKVALDRKKQEAGRIFDGDWADWSPRQKYAALAHIYLAFVAADVDGYELETYRPIRERIEDWLVHVFERYPELKHFTSLIAENLQILSKAGVSDQPVLSGFASEVVSRQQVDGRWHSVEIQPGETTATVGKRHLDPAQAAVFDSAQSTLLSLAALAEWSAGEERRGQRLERDWMAVAGAPPVTTLPPGDPPPREYREIDGKRVATGFPVKSQEVVDQLNQYRRDPDDAGLFFREDQLRAKVQSLEKSHAPTAERARAARLLDMVEKADGFHPSTRGIRGESAPGVLRLAVRLELSGPGSTPAFAERIRQAIEKTWMGSAGSVALSTSVQVALRSEGQPASVDMLQVYVPGLPEKHESPYTKREGDLGKFPTRWRADLEDAVIAHEMGHFFGFPDEYHIDVRNGFYYITYDTPDDLMSSPYGRMRPRYLETLAGAYK